MSWAVQAPSAICGVEPDQDDADEYLSCASFDSNIGEASSNDGDIDIDSNADSRSWSDLDDQSEVCSSEASSEDGRFELLQPLEFLADSNDQASDLSTEDLSLLEHVEFGGTPKCLGVLSSVSCAEMIEQHEKGTCRPCLYFSSRVGCLLGANCRFCHYPHSAGMVDQIRRRKFARPARHLASTTPQPQPLEHENEKLLDSSSRPSGLTISTESGSERTLGLGDSLEEDTFADFF